MNACSLHQHYLQRVKQLSSDTTVLLAAAERGIRQIYEPGYRLAKAGVLLLDLTPNHQVQESLIAPEQPMGRDMCALMEAVDHINARWGTNTVAVGNVLNIGTWKMRQERKTALSTTYLEQVPLAGKILINIFINLINQESNRLLDKYPIALP